MSMPQDPMSTNNDILIRTPRIFNSYLSTISDFFGRPNNINHGRMHRKTWSQFGIK